MSVISGPSQGHIDWISALTLCQSSRWYVVSGSRDGVIKVWKWRIGFKRLFCHITYYFLRVNKQDFSSLWSLLMNVFLICVLNVFYWIKEHCLFFRSVAILLRKPAKKHSQRCLNVLDWPCWLVGYLKSTAELDHKQCSNRRNLRHKLGMYSDPCI